MFAFAEAFEDQFRIGSHLRVLEGVEKTYELMQAVVDQHFPLHGKEGSNKTNNSISGHNRKGYQQTVSLIEALLPMYRTFKSSGLDSTESWNHILVFAQEFLSLFQTERVPSAGMDSPAAMIWGSFKATDLGEDFCKHKFIKHPILTAVERKGKSIPTDLASVQGECDPIRKLERQLKTVETNIEKLKDKVH